MSVEEELPCSSALRKSHWFSGGVEAPAVADRYSRPMAEELPNHVEPERPRRRVFGLFGGRKRSEPVAAPIEPRFDMLRSNAGERNSAARAAKPDPSRCKLLPATEDSTARSAENVRSLRQELEIFSPIRRKILRYPHF